MTDHANELRRYSRKIGHPAGDVPSVMLAAAEEIERLAARLEATESEALEQARLNGMGSEREAALMAKLEAAEEDRSNFLVEMGKLCAQCDALRAKIETAENDAAHQKALAASALRVAEGWERKCGELRAKVAEMGQQEPVAWQTRTRPAWNDGTWGPWRKCSKEYAEDIKKTPSLHDWLYEARALYALPGAQTQGEGK